MQVVADTVRQQLANAGSDTRRLFHGRGHCYEGFEHLVIDWFPPVAVARVYKDVEPEWTEQLCETLRQFDEIESLVLQQRRRGSEGGNQLVWGEPPELMTATEAGLKYWVKPEKNQNSGLFLDMREGRRWIRENSKDRTVLNLFSYTCSFSVAALAGGAEHVVNVDMSKGAIATGRDNHKLNEIKGNLVTYLAYDLFRSWKAVGKKGPYDIVVIDPPSFQRGSFIAEKDYRRVVRRLNEITNPDAQVLACHNDPKCDTGFIRDLMAEECPEFEFVERIDNPDDFPEAEVEKSLKVLLFRRKG